MDNLTLIDAKTLILVLFKNKLLIFLFALTGLCGGLLYTARQPIIHTYGATATVSVVFDIGNNAVSGVEILSNYRELITSYRIIEYAAELLEAEDLTIEQIRRMVSAASSRNNAHMLSITARNESPQTAILVANAVAASFVKHVSIITGNNSIQIFDFSRWANIVSQRGSRRIILFAPFGALLAICGFIIFMELVSGKLRYVKQCVTDPRELLAVIPIGQGAPMQTWSNFLNRVNLQKRNELK